MSAETWAIARFTVLMALLATALVLPPAIAIGWLLARKRFPGKALLETSFRCRSCCRRSRRVAAAVAAGPAQPRRPGARCDRDRRHLHLEGRRHRDDGDQLSAGGAQRARRHRAGRSPLREIAATLGAGPFRILRTITLPLASRGIAAGAVLGFSRALGEFGATIMIAGAIPGRTRTLAVGIYTLVETGREDAAWSLLAISALLAFGAIYFSNRLVEGKGHA